MSEVQVAPLTLLQEALEELIREQGGSERLVAALDETRSRLKAMETQFRATVDAESESTRLAVRDEIHAVEQSFSDYFGVLSTLDGYLIEFDVDYLADAHANLPVVIERLNLDFLRFREAVMAERGPTTHAGVNHLYGLASLILEGDPSFTEAFEDQRELEIIRAEAMTEALGQDPETAALEPTQRVFLEHYQDLLAADDFGSQAWLERLRQAGQIYSRVDLAYLGRRYGHGPTAVSQINLVINSAWLFLQGAVEVEVVHYYLERAERSLKEILSAHLQMQRGMSDDDANLAQADRVAEGAELMLACLDEYWSWLESPQPAELEQLFQKASEGAKLVENAFVALAHYEPARPTCTICGATAGQGETRCRSCGASLASVAEASFSLVEGAPATETSGLANASRFVNVIQLAELVLKQQASGDDLLAECDELEVALGLARKAQKNPDSINASESEKEAVHSAARDYAAGLQEMTRALGLLRGHAEDPSVESLEEARESLALVAERLSQTQQTVAPLARS